MRAFACAYRRSHHLTKGEDNMSCRLSNSLARPSDPDWAARDRQSLAGRPPTTPCADRNWGTFRTADGRMATQSTTGHPGANGQRSTTAGPGILPTHRQGPPSGAAPATESGYKTCLRAVPSALATPHSACSADACQLRARSILFVALTWSRTRRSTVTRTTQAHLTSDL